MKKLNGLPQRKLIRYLVTRIRKNKCSYYWQPPTKLRNLKNRPSWLKTTPLKGLTLPAAMQAAEVLNAQLDLWRKGQAQAAGPFARLVDLYLKSSQFLGLAPRTRRDYEAYLRLLQADMGHANPEAIQPAVVARYRDHLVAVKKVSERAADYHIQVLRLLFSWARRQGHLSGDNPASKPGLKSRGSRAGTWSLEQLRQMAKAPYPVGLSVRLAIYTMQRQGDILTMRWSDIEGDTIRVEQNKTGRKLVLPLHPRLRAALRVAPKYSDTILGRSDGKPYTEDGFRTMFYKASLRLGKDRPTFHDIRRTGASLLAAGGVSDSRVAQWTGHKRQGQDSILDTYIVNQSVLRKESFTIMNTWKV
jgi:integrase